MSNRGTSWKLVALLSLLLGVPWYFTTSLESALLVHALLAVGYAISVLLLGKGSTVGVWIPFIILSITAVTVLRLQQ